MGFAHGFATGTQVGNSWINTYNDAKLKAGLAKAGDFEPTDVASGEEAVKAGLAAKQFQINQLNVDDPDFASKYKQVEDDHAPMMAGLEANRAKASSQMVQLPGGRRIEQDGEFTPEQMAGLRAEQASKVYAQQGYPEEAAKSTLAAQGIANNQQTMQKNAFEIKALKRAEDTHAKWAAEDSAHDEYLHPDTPVAAKAKYGASLIKRALPLFDGNNPYAPGVIGKGVSKDGKEVTIEKDGVTRTVPITEALIGQAHQVLQLNRDTKLQTEYHMKMSDRLAAEKGDTERMRMNNETQVGIANRNNASAERVAKIRAAEGGSAGISALPAEDRVALRKEVKDIEDDPQLSSPEKDDKINRVMARYGQKIQLREPNPAAGLKDGITPDGSTMVKDGKTYARVYGNKGVGDSWVEMSGMPEPVAQPTIGLPKPAASSLPPQALSSLKEGVITHFKNGQNWTLKNGTAVEVK